MKSHNHHLVEVLCGFWFEPSSNIWDSTFFGKYFDLIFKEGYTEKHEQQGIQVKLEVKGDEIGSPTAQAEKLELRMLFKNPSKNTAILMSSNFISFHKLEPYSDWENFLKEEISPGIKSYLSIGLGKNLQKVQMLYLNRYDLDSHANLGDTFSFLPSVGDFGIGKERSLLFQSQYELDPNLLMQIKLNASLPNSQSKQVFLECSCIANNTLSSDNDWSSLANQAHNKNNEVFRLITNKK
jgi:uncharacterized protein (TIGR04255 family)